MVTLTNKSNLPEIFVRAVEGEKYSSGDTDYSATQLIRGGYQVMLEKEHRDDIVEDVADRVYALQGSSVHYMIELAAEENDIVEKRFFHVVSGKKISAQIDHFDTSTRIISDWKVTASYGISKAMAEGKKDWENQLNIQAYLMRENGIVVDGVQIIAIARDYQKSKKGTNGYPMPVEKIVLPLWEINKQKDFVMERVVNMINQTKCNQSERWQDDPTYAVMKVGAKRAVKVEKEEQLAFDYCEDKGWMIIDDYGSPIIDDDHYIQTRVPPNRRCEFYCSVNQWCDFYKSEYLDSKELPFK